jgi:hypothetical protein
MRRRTYTTAQQKRPHKKAAEKPVSLSPLGLEDALRGLLQIPDPEATRPKAKPKRGVRR